jgi:hypothetical protein
MPFPEGYLPREGDVLVLHGRVKFDWDLEEDKPERAIVWIDVEGHDGRHAIRVALSCIVGIKRRTWKPGEAVCVRNAGGIFGNVVSTSGDYVWVALDDNSEKPRHAGTSGHATVHCNEIEPLLQPSPQEKAESAKFFAAFADKPKPSNFAIALAEALPKEVGSAFAMIERPSRDDVLIVTPGFIMPGEDRHRLQKIAFALGIPPAPVRLAFSDVEPDDQGLLPNERSDPPRTWESDQGPRPIPPFDPAASPMEPDAELRQRLRKKMLSRGVIPPADLNLVEVATGADLDKLAAYYNLNRYALSEEEFQGRIAADEAEGAALRNPEEPL